jgi:hypothetical protein
MLSPPVQVLTKWGEYSPDVQFILQRSPLDAAASKGRAPPPLLPAAAIWKAPPGSGSGGPPGKPLIGPLGKTDSARLSPDSGA